MYSIFLIVNYSRQGWFDNIKFSEDINMFIHEFGEGDNVVVNRNMTVVVLQSNNKKHIHDFIKKMDSKNVFILLQKDNNIKLGNIDITGYDNITNTWYIVKLNDYHDKFITINFPKGFNDPSAVETDFDNKLGRMLKRNDNYILSIEESSKLLKYIKENGFSEKSKLKCNEIQDKFKEKLALGINCVTHSYVISFLF